MLFCHGFGMDQTLWRNLLPAFQDAHQVILMDLIGCGGSDLGAYRRDKYASIRGHVEDLVELCRVLDLRDLVYVGHSVGAMIGLQAALAAPERFAGLVMVGASPRYLDDEGYRGGFTAQDVEDLLAGFDTNRQAWSEQLGRLAVAHPEHPDHPDWVREVCGRFQSTDPAIFRTFAQATFAVDFRADLGACRTPVLLLQSREDPIVPVAVSEYLRSAIPESALQYLACAGHFPQLTAPRSLTDAISAFLGRLEQPRG